MLTGDAANTDPVCSLSPLHHLITDVVDAAQGHMPAGVSAGVPAGVSAPIEARPLLFRNTRNAKKIATAKEE